MKKDPQFLDKFLNFCLQCSTRHLLNIEACTLYQRPHHITFCMNVTVFSRKTNPLKTNTRFHKNFPFLRSNVQITYVNSKIQQTKIAVAKIKLSIEGRNSECPNVSTTPITAMGCRQCLSLSVVQLKGKHCRKPHCRNGVVDTFGHLV